MDNFFAVGIIDKPPFLVGNNYQMTIKINPKNELVQYITFRVSRGMFNNYKRGELISVYGIINTSSRDIGYAEHIKRLDN